MFLVGERFSMEDREKHMNENSYVQKIFFWGKNEPFGECLGILLMPPHKKYKKIHLQSTIFYL